MNFSIIVVPLVQSVSQSLFSAFLLIALQPRIIDIGVAKMPCAICSITASAMNNWLSSHGANFQFRLPGAHNRYYPWTPPRWLPISVLENLEEVLLCRLKGMVIDKEGLYRSKTSSPSAADEPIKIKRLVEPKTFGDEMKAIADWVRLCVDTISY